MGGDSVRAFVVWEPVLPTDIGPPSTADLARCSDARARQFWDPDGSTSRAIDPARGEHHKVWDWVGVIPPGAKWAERVPGRSFEDGPVDLVREKLQAALAN